jgi:hypothetical protein
MSKGIYLSKKHGLNPSLEVCPVCGEDVGVILFGKLKANRTDRDPEAPRRTYLSLEPCGKCKEKIGDGLVIYESEDGKNITGNVIAITREAATRIFPDHAMRKVLMVDKEVFKLLTPEPDTSE